MGISTPAERTSVAIMVLFHPPVRRSEEESTVHDIPGENNEDSGSANGDDHPGGIRSANFDPSAHAGPRECELHAARGR